MTEKLITGTLNKNQNKNKTKLTIWSKNLIKGRNFVANLRKTTIYFTNVDLVNDDVYTKFGLILSIRSQDIE